MPWVKFDDQFPIHQKIERLSDGAYRLHQTAIFWSSRQLTDGYVPEVDLLFVVPRTMKRPKKFVAELVASGLWEDTGDGWVIHDYLDYQPSKAQVMADRAKTAERQRRWRERHKDDVTDAVSNGVSNAVTDGVSNGGCNAAPTRPVLEGSKEPSSAATLRTKTARRIPEPFPVTDDMKDWVRKETPDVNAWRELNKFVDYFRGAPDRTGRKKDWLATWRNWMRNAQERTEHETARSGGARHIEATDERCPEHPRQLAGHCPTCASNQKGRAA